MGYDPTAKYYFTVTNQGPAAAGPFSVSVSGEGSFAIPGLAAGTSATRTFRTACLITTWQATADSVSQVAESNESNNTRSYTEPGPCFA
jgi:subtilase family serine protease